MNLRDFLLAHRIHAELLLHRPASCASRLAQTLHVPGRQVAKAVLLRGPEEFVLAVLPATHRIDFERLAMALGVDGLRLATEAELDQVFVDCEHGALPPFGSCYGVRTVVDAGLAGQAEIVAEGHLRHVAFRIRFRDFETLEQPLRARFARMERSERHRGRRRRAG